MSAADLENIFPKLGDDEFFYISKEGLAKILTKYDPKVPGRHMTWTTDYNVELPIRMKKSGPGSE